MSAVRSIARTSQRAPRPSLRLLPSLAFRTNRPAAIVGGGLVVTVILGLVLNVFIAQSAYEMAHLKMKTRELTTTAQVLREQVDSLSSNQNLEQTAADLGMVSNNNPVFIDLASQKVFGHPQAATAGSSLAGNLIANSALVTKTNISTLQAAIAAKSNLQAAASAKLKAKYKAARMRAKTRGLNVAAVKNGTQQVSLPSGGIPGSPTN